MLKIQAVVGNPPYNLNRTLVSHRFLAACLRQLSPDYLQFIIPVSTSDPRPGSYDDDYVYVRKYFYGSNHIFRTYDFYRGYLIFKDSTNSDLGCIDGGVEAIVYKRWYGGRCRTTFFANRTDKLSFLSSYYWFPEVRLRHPMDIRIVNKLYPSAPEWYGMKFWLDESPNALKLCPDNYYCITISGAVLHFLHEVYFSKVYNIDCRVCLKRDYVPPSEGEGMDVHRRLLAVIPEGKVLTAVSYVTSRFFHYLIRIVQTSRHIDSHTLRLVPSAPLTADGDDVWTDELLFDKYELTAEMREHILKCTCIMPVPRTAVFKPYEVAAEDLLKGAPFPT